MLADIPAVAYTASWGGFLSAEFTANFKIDFFTSSRLRNPSHKDSQGTMYRKSTFTHLVLQRNGQTEETPQSLWSTDTCACICAIRNGAPMGTGTAVAIPLKRSKTVLR